jgi:hypothetical protein
MVCGMSIPLEKGMVIIGNEREEWNSYSYYLVW